mmetsp:Transcript_37290/g.107438  ORF Transcript_37290/g.107438 Transcript_37290/m.107438 type:complete len:222 (-) Transcript_37290:459-1124(-)
MPPWPLSSSSLVSSLISIIELTSFRNIGLRSPWALDSAPAGVPIGLAPSPSTRPMASGVGVGRSRRGSTLMASLPSFLALFMMLVMLVSSPSGLLCGRSGAGAMIFSATAGSHFGVAAFAAGTNSGALAESVPIAGPLQPRPSAFAGETGSARGMGASRPWSPGARRLRSSTQSRTSPGALCIGVPLQDQRWSARPVGLGSEKAPASGVLPKKEPGESGHA